MTQMIEGPPPVAQTVPPEGQWASPDKRWGSPEQQWSSPEQQWSSPEQQWDSPEQQWTDWGRTQASGGRPKARPRFFRPAVVVPLGVFTALTVIGGLFLMFADPAGAAGFCGGAPPSP